MAGSAVPASGWADPWASRPDPVADGQIWWLTSSPAHVFPRRHGWDMHGGRVVGVQGYLGALLVPLPCQATSRLEVAREGCRSAASVAGSSGHRAGAASVQLVDGGGAVGPVRNSNLVRGLLKALCGVVV